MHLREIIDSIDRENDEFCIVAKRPWTQDSEAQLVRLTEDFKIPPDVLEQGYEYFLEVSVAIDEVLDGLEEALSTEQRFKALLFYAEHDAYPDWLCSLRDQTES